MSSKLKESIFFLFVTASYLEIYSDFFNAFCVTWSTGGSRYLLEVKVLLKGKGF